LEWTFTGVRALSTDRLIIFARWRPYVTHLITVPWAHASPLPIGITIGSAVSLM